MKLNKLMAAVALVAAGAANAALDQPSQGNGSLLFLAFDQVGSPVSIGIDLGLNVNNFRDYDLDLGSFVTGNGLTSGYHKITWNFLTNTVSTATPNSVVNTFDLNDGSDVVTSTGAVVAGITGNAWSTAFSQFSSLAQAGDVRFAVIGADSGTGYYLSSGNNAANLQTLNNGSANNFALTDLGLYATTNQLGTHTTANNGANVVTGTAQPSLINSAIWGAADGWVTNSNFGANTAAGVTQNNFFTLDNNTLERTVVLGNTGTPTNSASLLNNRATWSFNLAQGTLTYETVQVAAAVVPEPETYALVLAGLLTVGALARRRQA